MKQAIAALRFARTWRAAAIYGSFLVTAALTLTAFFHVTSGFGTHMGSRAPALMQQFAQAFADGELYPRWMPAMNGGYGYPTFVYYQPALFFAALPLSGVLGAEAALLWTMVLIAGVGAAGMFALVRRLTGEPVTAWFCAMLFLLTPYLYVDWFVRGALAELMAMLLVPWPLFLLVVLRDCVAQQRAVRWAVLGLGVSVAALVTAHPIIAMFFLPLLGILALVMLFEARLGRRRFLFALVGAALLGLLLSSPFWLTTLTMRPYVNLDKAFDGYYAAEGHTVYAAQFLDPTWGFGGSTVDNPSDDMSFQLGLPHLLLALVGLFLGRRSHFLVVCAAFYGGLVILMTPLADPLWALKPFKYAQFPWRLLALTATFQVLLASGLSALWAASPRRKLALMAVVLALVTAFHHHQFEAQSFDNDFDETKENFDSTLSSSFKTMADTNEFTPRTASERPTHPRGNQPIVEASAGGTVTFLEGSTDRHIVAQVVTSAPNRVQIRQLYLPGWRVSLDGETVPTQVLEAGLDAFGLMWLDVGPGTHRLEAGYDGPPGWRWRNLVIFLGLLVFGGTFFWERRARSKTTSAAESTAEQN
ncbi:MAG: hypothetical protein CO108_18520 [Deltaproteobacteria bacterium CG_4_9_14_3_um_filter_63_12]|nr:MAG: hypothetical protein CO108_18520 [Deltaproteobacteria bacterium CG_4_9_14_3_um_filter_63_12]